MRTIPPPEAIKSEVVSPLQAVSTPGSQAALVTLPLALLSLGHLTVDFYSSAVGTLQPVFVERHALSLAQAGTLGGAFMFASSVMQLFFGWISDRLHSRMIAVLGLLAAGVFLSSVGLAVGFKSLLLLIVLGGVGVAAYHPQSTTHAAAIAGHRRGLGVAVFITSGTLGLSLGPVYFSLMTEWFGFESLYLAAIPALVVSLILFRRLPKPFSSPAKSQHFELAALQNQRKPLLLHYVLVLLRSTVQLGIGQFLTLYLVADRGYSLRQASLGLALFFASAAMGSLLGGGLADRLGGKRVVLISMAASSPFLALFLGTSGWISLLCLFVGGVILLLTIPVNVVMAQELAPSQAGTVTALMMGFAWGMAGITFVPLIGWLADHAGLESVLWGVVMLPVFGFLPALKLPPRPPLQAGEL